MGSGASGVDIAADIALNHSNGDRNAESVILSVQSRTNIVPKYFGCNTFDIKVRYK